MRHLPEVAEAWERGHLSSAHLDLVASVRREGTEEALSRDERLLVRQAKSLRFEQFARAVAYWDQMADPDGTEEAAEAQRARRDVYLEASFNGTFLGKMTLDPVAGAIVAGELGRIEQEFFEADWARAKAEYGENAEHRRPLAHPGPATGRCARRDGLALGVGASRGAPPGAALQRAGRLAHVERPDLRARRGDRRDPGFVGPLARTGGFRAGRHGFQGPSRGQCDVETVLGGDPPSRRVARPPVRPSLLRPRGASLRGRPCRALGRRRADHIRTTVACSVPSTTACATESGRRPADGERRRAAHRRVPLHTTPVQLRFDRTETRTSSCVPELFDRAVSVWRPHGRCLPRTRRRGHQPPPRACACSNVGRPQGTEGRAAMGTHWKATRTAVLVAATCSRSRRDGSTSPSARPTAASGRRPGPA